MNIKQVMAVAAMAGVLAAVLAYFWFESKARELEDLSTPAPVLVTVKNVPTGTRIDDTLVKVKQIPRKFIQPGALRAPEEAEGQLALAPLAPGEQVLPNKLSVRGVILSQAVPVGKRAVTVSVDLAGGVAGLIKPGDLVDVLVTLNDPEMPKTFALIQAAPVLAVGQSFTAQPAGQEVGMLGLPQADTVTLAASPYEAQQLTHIETIGRIKLTLRAPGDRDRHPLPELIGYKIRGVGAAEEAIKRR